MAECEENTMGSKEVLEEALKLRAEERFIVIEGLIKSLDEPDATLDEIWAEEAEKRLHAYREGKLRGVPMEEVFGEN
jgi:putative addiction module component (TIGR02574 family)